MTEGKIVVSLTGREFELPENIAPEVDEFITNVVERTDGKFAQSTYGHAAIAIATKTILVADLGASPEEQLQIMRDRALKIIEEFGLGIIPLLRDELMLALTEEDLASIGY